MNPNVKFILDLAAGMGAASVPVGVSIIVAIWRTARRLDHNTDAVRQLVDKIDGTIIEPGIDRRLRALEQDKVARDARAEARREIGQGD